MNLSFRFLTGLLFIFLSFSLPLSAEEIVYDRYAAAGLEGELLGNSSGAGEMFKNWGKHFLVYPFELVRWPIDQTLVFVEKHHVDDKVEWVYEQMKNHGVTPKVRSLLGGEGLGGGFDIDVTKLSGMKENLPNLTVEGSALWTVDHLTLYEGKLTLERIAGTELRAEEIVRYENRGEEHFYGIGPNTSLGDGTSFRMERSTFETALGLSFLNTWDVRGHFSFQNVNITNGEDGGRGIIDEIFVRTNRQVIPGLGGDELVNLGVKVEHDNRDLQDLPSRGGYQRFYLGYTKGMDGSSGFLTYRGEAAHFVKFLSDRQVLALRGVAEHHDELGDRQVPFFGMSRLGGYGVSPRLGDAHRGFKRDRFFDESLLLANLEYRWTVYNYRDWRMDAVVFWDEGQVFGEWSGLQWDDFRSSVGFGVRISMADDILLTLEIARSGDGTEFYAKTKTPF